MFNNPVLLMAVMTCIFMAMITTTFTVKAYQRKAKFSRLIIILGIGLFFIITTYLMFIK